MHIYFTVASLWSMSLFDFGKHGNDKKNAYSPRNCPFHEGYKFTLLVPPVAICFGT